MASESDENVVVDEAPKRRFGAPAKIVVPVLLVIALIVGVSGGIVYYQSAKALRTELVTLKKELKELKDLGQKRASEDNTVALEAALKEMRLQVETLTKQIDALMASVAAHASPDESAARNTVAGGKAPAPTAGESVQQAKGNQPEAKGPVKSPETGVKKNDVRNCGLIGKSPEEQAVILKRCVSLIDPPSEKGKSSP
ncbi:MAG: hypothetical protein QM739_03535 [Propionivibrio sp.]